MIESHPFESFIPDSTQYLLLGSFTGRRSEGEIKDGYDWFYGTKRSQFWPIIREVYGMELISIDQKQNLFSSLGLAVADIILSCERKLGNNLDSNLINITLNYEVENILRKDIKTILFSSKFVEKQFAKYFKDVIRNYPDTKLITLPSPSPRYALISKADKVKIYKNILPKI